MGKRTVELALLALFVLSTTPVLAQVIVNPRTVEYDPSADHNAVTPDGQPLVLRYDLDIYPTGAAQALYVVNLGKPTPDPDGKIRVDFAARLPLWPLPNGTYEARVSAVGTTGQGLSDPSNQFAFQSCSFSVSPLTRSVGAAGGPTTVTVTADAGCGWAATSNAAWISVSPASGSGTAIVTLALQANPGSNLRTGTVTIAGQTVTVSQDAYACPYSLGSNAQAFSAAGGAGTVSVTTIAGCAWSATSGAAWVTLSPANGSGTGTVGFTVAANPTAAARSATLAIAGQTFTVTQDALACSFALGSTSSIVAAGGRTGSVTVTSPSGCSWTAASPVSWITVSPANGNGTGTVSFTVAANPAAAARTATLTIANQSYAITQDAATCTYSLGGTLLRVGSAGGGAAVSLTCLSDCGWTATSAATWVTVSPARGTGPASVTVTVAANDSTSARTGTLTLAGTVVTVTQDAKTGPQAPRGLKVIPRKKK